MHIAFPASLLGTRLDGRYRLDRLIGEGASAWVFAAHDERLDRSVAVKVLKPRQEDGDWRRRFVAEGRMLARLVHPHVVLVHDAGETADGLAYLVMELSEAGTLEAELFRRGALPVAETLHLLLPLLGALACAHDRGIVHRDIKPANIVLAREARSTRAKVLDFGIARPSDSGTDSASGTPSYMAPEQARGARATSAVDVWALGVVFFQCLSGRLPFEAANSLDGLLKLVNERAPLFAEACPGLGSHLGIALDRALERDVERRYPDMRSFAYALIVACAQDDVALPARIEPLGLPEGDAWFAGADGDGTRPLEPAERAAVAVALVRSVPARGSHGRVAAAALAVMVLAIAFAWALPNPKETARARAPARVSHGVTAQHAGAPFTVKEVPVPEAVTPTLSAPPQAATAHSESAKDKLIGPHRRTRTRSLTRVRDQSTPSTEKNPPTPLESKSGVIKNWDW